MYWHNLRSSATVHTKRDTFHNLYTQGYVRLGRIYETSQRRLVHLDGRNRLSSIWLPTGGVTPTSGERADSHSLLLQAGFLRQAYAGIFHLLPLGLRVQQKIENLIDRYMQKLGASKVSLSSISSESLWEKSGRLTKVSSEVFHFQDRKDTRYLLGPTHEEEITALVASDIKSYKELPLRIYQVSRKYRDEPRPRQGLLRTREFLMKDLYTFDVSAEQASRTYQDVCNIYRQFFNELKLPYLVAEASSGDMGGDLSHEYHFATPKGEDQIISCPACGYAANEEVAEGKLNLDVLYDEPNQEYELYIGKYPTAQSSPNKKGVLLVSCWVGISGDKSHLVQVYYPTFVDTTSDSASRSMHEVNTHAVRSIIPSLDSSIQNPLEEWTTSIQEERTHENDMKDPRIIKIIDCRLPASFVDSEVFKAGSQMLEVLSSDRKVPVSVETNTVHPKTGHPLDLLQMQSGQPCSRCKQGHIIVQKSVELGHTFYLGTRYSKPLHATVNVPVGVSSISGTEYVQMGCHGIGVSRMIGATADALSDEKGLNWPRIIAPFEVVVVPGKGQEESAQQVYDILVESSRRDKNMGAGEIAHRTQTSLDVIFDDRDKDFTWKLRDADLIGFPVIVIVGRAWKHKKCEVQSRRLGLRTEVDLAELPSYVETCLARL